MVVGAGHPLGEAPLAGRPRGSASSGTSTNSTTSTPTGQAERGLDRVGQPALERRVAALGDEAVDHDVDGVLDLLLELGRLGERHHLAVDPGAGEALGLELGEQVDVLPLAGPHDRREHLEAGPLGQLEQPVDDLLRALPGDRLATDRAVRPTRAGEEQAEVVVDLGDGADGRARVAVGRLLVDRDRRGQPLDEVDVGLVHLAEELAGVGRQRLDVAALALGEDRVEGQRGLARPRQPGEDDQRVAGQLDRDVLEVVLARTTDDELVVGGVERRAGGGVTAEVTRPILGGPTDSPHFVRAVGPRVTDVSVPSRFPVLALGAALLTAACTAPVRPVEPPTTLELAWQQVTLPEGLSPVTLATDGTALLIGALGDARPRARLLSVDPSDALTDVPLTPHSPYAFEGRWTQVVTRDGRSTPSPAPAVALTATTARRPGAGPAPVSPSRSSPSGSSAATERETLQALRMPACHLSFSAPGRVIAPASTSPCGPAAAPLGAPAVHGHTPGQHAGGARECDVHHLPW